MIYELRTYTANPGCMPALQARFRDHTCRLFEKHGIRNVGYWTNAIGGRSNELVYLLAYESLAAREQSWAAFVQDPEWQQAFADSGPLTAYTQNVIMKPTDFSPLT